jgi:HSP20 family molecular chaperone IbpA
MLGISAKIEKENEAEEEGSIYKEGKYTGFFRACHLPIIFKMVEALQKLEIAS